MLRYASLYFVTPASIMNYIISVLCCSLCVVENKHLLSKSCNEKRKRVKGVQEEAAALFKIFQFLTCYNGNLSQVWRVPKGLDPANWLRMQ